MAVDNSGTIGVLNGDGRVNSRIANYTAFFETDSKNDSEEHKKNRLENYTDVVNGKDDRFTLASNTFTNFLLEFNRIL
jgi:hypothetical protein